MQEVTIIDCNQPHATEVFHSYMLTDASLPDEAGIQSIVEEGRAKLKAETNAERAKLDKELAERIAEAEARIDRAKNAAMSPGLSISSER